VLRRISHAITSRAFKDVEERRDHVEVDDGVQITTLNDFIREQEASHVDATGRFTEMLVTIALGTKIVSKGVNRAGLAAMLGLSGKTNVQGEEVQKLDQFADKVFAQVLGRCGQFVSLVSEEQAKIVPATEGGASSNYVIAFDPLDGSSNIDVNVSIGTIWGIYRRVTGGTPGPEGDRDFLQPGYDQVAAGYAIYGSSTMFVFSTGDGVHGFTLDPTIGEFILTHRSMKIPEDGSLYSCNESNYSGWSPGVQRYIDSLKNPSDPDARRYSQRYVGSLVADFHRTLLKGGVFLYPADNKNEYGKLRLLYECAPMAFLAEQAGGAASDGVQRVLNITADGIHQRTPFFTGSVKMVSALEESIREHG